MEVDNTYQQPKICAQSVTQLFHLQEDIIKIYNVKAKNKKNKNKWK